MKRWFEPSIAVVALVGVVWLSFSNGQEISRVENEADRTDAQQFQPEIAAFEGRAGVTQSPPKASAGPESLRPLGMSGHEFSRRGGDRRTLAFSADEAAWLGKHGFPKPRELLELRTTAKSELEHRANSGDPVGMALLAKRMEIDGECASAAAAKSCAKWYEHAAQAGSLYAMREFGPIAGYYRENGVPPDDLATMNAYTLLSEYLGYPDAATYLVGSKKRSAPSLEDFNAAQAEVPLLLARINSERAKQGKPPLVSDPRPLRSAEAMMTLAGLAPGDPLVYPRD